MIVTAQPSAHASSVKAPEISPVVAFSARPVGSVPLTTSKDVTKPVKVGSPLENTAPTYDVYDDCAYARSVGA